MRVMVIVKATAQSEAGEMPGAEWMAAVGAFNQMLVAAGVMQDGGGLKRSELGARVTNSGDVTRGPFGTLGELASGYWLWTVKDLDEAIEWARQCPTSPDGPLQLEIRPLFEMADFG